MKQKTNKKTQKEQHKPTYTVYTFSYDIDVLKEYYSIIGINHIPHSNTCAHRLQETFRSTQQVLGEILAHPLGYRAN